LVFLSLSLAWIDRRLGCANTIHKQEFVPICSATIRDGHPETGAFQPDPPGKFLVGPGKPELQPEALGNFPDEPENALI